MTDFSRHLKTLGQLTRCYCGHCLYFSFRVSLRNLAGEAFLQSRLQQKFPAVYACIITGLIWGAWYYPDFIIGNWEYTNVAQISLFSFTIASSIFIGWLFIQTNENVFIAMLAHFGANIVFTFSPLFKVYGDLNHVSISLYLGIVWLIVFVIVGIYGMDLKGKKISKRTNLSGL